MFGISQPRYAANNRTDSQAAGPEEEDTSDCAEQLSLARGLVGLVDQAFKTVHIATYLLPQGQVRPPSVSRTERADCRPWVLGLHRRSSHRFGILYLMSVQSGPDNLSGYPQQITVCSVSEKRFRDDQHK